MEDSLGRIAPRSERCANMLSGNAPIPGSSMQRIGIRPLPALLLPALLMTGAAAMTSTAAETTSSEGETLPQNLSAGALMTYCASSSVSGQGRQRQRYCAGFMSGVEETLRMLSASETEASYPALCVPANTSARKLQDTYRRHAGRPGTDLNRPAAVVAVEALIGAYPCPNE